MKVEWELLGNWKGPVGGRQGNMWESIYDVGHVCAHV
jgi:hypothetical protein